MPEQPAVDPAGLSAIVDELKKLLRDPNALRAHAKYSEPWTDATNAARTWGHEEEQAKARELEAAGCRWSGEVAWQCIKIKLEVAQRSKTGFFAARRKVQERLDELQALLDNHEFPQARAERLRVEIDRLQRAAKAISDDEEYGSALSVVGNMFAAVENYVRRIAPSWTAVLGPTNGAAFARTVIRDTCERAADCRAQAKRELLAEVKSRLESARIELHKATVATLKADLKPKNGPEVENVGHVPPVGIDGASAPTAERAEPTVDDDSHLSPTKLAELFSVPADALRTRLNRWREHNHAGWIEDPNRGPRDPKYIYRVGTVRPIINAMKATSKTTSERPAKKK